MTDVRGWDRRGVEVKAGDTVRWVRNGSTGVVRTISRDGFVISVAGAVVTKPSWEIVKA